MSGQAAHRIGLGTVPFGLDYGITNRSGRVSPALASHILALAHGSGIDILDTAHLYGDSETVIGSAEASAPFRIVTKTPKFGGCTSTADVIARFTDALGSSLSNLGRPQVDALLVHDADDLLGANGETLWKELEAARDRGLARKIGVSVYDGDQVDRICDRFPIEIVQLPWNPLDDRLVAGGQLARLVDRGIEIHARSLFLQGLLLLEPSSIPAKFGPLREAIVEFHAWARAHNLPLLTAVLALAFGTAAISRFIIGTTSIEELSEVLGAADEAAALSDLSFKRSVALDERHLNPSLWSQLGEGQ